MANNNIKLLTYRESEFTEDCKFKVDVKRDSLTWCFGRKVTKDRFLEHCKKIGLDSRYKQEDFLWDLMVRGYKIDIVLLIMFDID